MPKVTFGYDIHKDAWSWVLIAQDKDCWGLDWKNQVIHIPDELLKKIIDNEQDKAIAIISNYISNNKFLDYKKKIIDAEIQSLKKIWRSKEITFFDRLKILTVKTIYQNDFSCFFTTGFMCPYNIDDSPNWFMTSIWKSIPDHITTICHELLHLQFIHYWKDEISEKIGEEKFEDLKEAITFLLNE